MKYKTFKLMFAKMAKKYDEKKWDNYVCKDKMCFIVPPILFFVMVVAMFILFILGLNTYGYIALGLALFFGGRYTYKICGAFKASKKK